MSEAEKVWLHTTEEKLRSLLADEAKEQQMLLNIESVVKQLKAKNQFRIALVNQLIEESNK
jgi:hypothetical protein